MYQRWITNCRRFFYQRSRLPTAIWEFQSSGSKQLLNDEEIERIREAVVLQMTPRDAGNVSENILPLFKAQYFQVLDGGDYLDIIQEQAEKMVLSQDADSAFPEFVIQRENLYPTVFMNGIATPHPIQLNAKRNTVGITILRNCVFFLRNGNSIDFLD